MQSKLKQFETVLDRCDQYLSNDALLDDILNRVVHLSLQTYQEKIHVGIQDSLHDILLQFKKEIVLEIHNAAQTWIVSTKKEKTLFPKNCRFLYTMGDSTFVVIEEDPKNRTLSLDKSLVTGGKSNLGSSERLNLALPYCVFVLHFVTTKTKMGESLKQMYLAWRFAPLTSLNDPLFVPLLPNIHQNLAICFGGKKFEGNICEQTNQAIQYFWNSQFNNDLSQFWWAKEHVDVRVRNAITWKQSTEANSLFVLEIKTAMYKTLNTLLEECLKSRQQTDFFLEKEIASKVENLSKNIYNGVLRYLKHTKFEKFYPKDVKDVLKDSIEPIVKEIYSLFLLIQTDVEYFASKIPSTEFQVQSKSIFWK
jgi:hypothetical protein